MSQREVQIDRLVGPTHHFGGLGVGNVASQLHAGQQSNPAAAALQGLDKMRVVASTGNQQLILPPQPRPHYPLLRSLGFRGTDRDVLLRAADESPRVLSAATSCSAMWTANAATVTAGVDSGGSAHPVITIANLVASLHRAIEPEQTWKDLDQVLSSLCSIHAPLPGGAAMRDEGAANHMRLATGKNRPGINVFVYGDGSPNPRKHSPRQSLAACQAIARLHDLPEENTFFLKQHPEAIDAGAFHNDVVAMSHRNLLIHHELAFLEEAATLRRLEQRYEELANVPLVRVEVPAETLSLAAAVDTYLFNSQIINAENSAAPTIICTSDVKQDEAASGLVDQWCQQGMFGAAHFVHLRQSMSGGGGPACLRLRVPVAEEFVPQRAAWTTSLDEQLREAITEHYPASLTLSDLARVEFHREAEAACRRVNEILRGHR